MRLLLALCALALPACTISYYGQEEVEDATTTSEPSEATPREPPDAAIPMG